MTQKIKNEEEVANSSSTPKTQQQKKKKKKKKKSIGISNVEDNLLNQIIVSDGKGKSIVELSNDNTNQMGVYQAVEIQFQENILMDILSRLPVRSLLRFKCVSRYWETLISDPYFMMKHLNRSKNDQDSQKLLISQMCFQDCTLSMYSYPLSLVQPVENVQKLDCPSPPTPLRCTIHSCYDGLVVVEVLDSLNADEHARLLLWNPSTRESIVLPAPELPVETSCFGLGYDSTSGQYKILHVHHKANDCKLPNEILALKGGSWRQLDKHPRDNYSLVFGVVQVLAFVHEAFHWINISRDGILVVSFSISNEVYREIPLPEEMLSSRDTFGISVLGGMLCVNSNSYCPVTTKLWVLKEYGVKDSWIPLLSVEDPSMFIAIPKYRFANGDVLFWCANCVGVRLGHAVDHLDHGVDVISY